MKITVESFYVFLGSRYVGLGTTHIYVLDILTFRLFDLLGNFFFHHFSFRFLFDDLFSLIDTF